MGQNVLKVRQVKFWAISSLYALNCFGTRCLKNQTRKVYQVFIAQCFNTFILYKLKALLSKNQLYFFFCIFWHAKIPYLLGYRTIGISSSLIIFLSVLYFINLLCPAKRLSIFLKIDKKAVLREKKFKQYCYSLTNKLFWLEKKTLIKPFLIVITITAFF